jgi:hypothetical protein
MVLAREVGRDGLCLCFFYPSPLKFAPNGLDGPNLHETISAVRFFSTCPLPVIKQAYIYSLGVARKKLTQVLRVPVLKL